MTISKQIDSVFNDKENGSPEEVVIPVHIQIRYSVSAENSVVTGKKATDSAGTVSEEELFAEKVPYMVTDYSDRTGYDEDFLGIKLPLPSLTSTIVAKTKEGENYLHYEHFSIAMHAKRRMALCTVSNVDGAPDKRTPDKTKKYGRKVLGELGPSDSETWVPDSRLDDQYQLTDAFYNKDRQSFDKGHIVRREDVCWGDSYDQVKKANGDTFHITNCSPQVANFNQGKLGGLWGELEDLVLKQVKKEQEKYSVTAGPVFSSRDSVFQGYSRDGIIKVKIPGAYWKIVSFVESGNLHSYAFLLEQELTHVQWQAEFEVSDDWTPYLISIKDLESKLDGISFAQELIDSDQSTSNIATEMLSNSVLQRFS